MCMFLTCSWHVRVHFQLTMSMFVYMFMFFFVNTTVYMFIVHVHVCVHANVMLIIMLTDHGHIHYTCLCALHIRVHVSVHVHEHVSALRMLMFMLMKMFSPVSSASFLFSSPHLVLLGLLVANSRHAATNLYKHSRSNKPSANSLASRRCSVGASMYDNCRCRPALHRVEAKMSW